MDWLIQSFSVVPSRAKSADIEHCVCRSSLGRVQCAISFFWLLWATTGFDHRASFFSAIPFMTELVRCWLRHCVNSLISPAPPNLARFLPEFAINRFASSILCRCQIFLVYLRSVCDIEYWRLELSWCKSGDCPAGSEPSGRTGWEQRPFVFLRYVEVFLTFRRVLQAYKFSMPGPFYVTT